MNILRFFRNDDDADKANQNSQSIPESLRQQESDEILAAIVSTAPKIRGSDPYGQVVWNTNRVWIRAEACLQNIDPKLFQQLVLLNDAMQPGNELFDEYGHTHEISEAIKHNRKIQLTVSDALRDYSKSRLDAVFKEI